MKRAGGNSKTPALLVFYDKNEKNEKILQKVLVFKKNALSLYR